MLPDKKRGVFVCRKCGYEEPLDPEAASKYKITQKIKHEREDIPVIEQDVACLLYTSPSPRDVEESRMPSSA